MTKLLLTGATGLVGAAALKMLLADERVTRGVAPTRRAFAPRLRLLNPIINSTDMPDDAKWWMVDSAICALGTRRAKSRSAAACRAIDALAIATQVFKRGAARFALTSAMDTDAGSLFRYTRIIAAPNLPAGARTGPTPTAAALIEGVLRGSPGRRVIGSAETTRAAESRR